MVSYTSVSASLLYSNTSLLDVTAAVTTTFVTDITVTNTVTETTTDVLPGRRRRRRTAPAPNCTVRLASLLNIETSLVSDFCSCEAPGATSTTTLTVTQDVLATTHPVVVSYTGTATPSPTYMIATQTDTTTLTVSTATSIVDITASATVTATAVQTAFVTAPSCSSSTVSANDEYGNQVYTQYFFGYGTTENVNNPGNDQPGFPPLTTMIAGSVPDCSAIAACAEYAAEGTNIYYSFDLHFLDEEEEWQCVAYYDQNSDPAEFDVPNTDVGRVYGYDIASIS